MHVFTALATAAPGRTTEATALVTRLRDAATASHGIPTSAWVVVAGAPYGTYALTTRLEGTGQLLEAHAKLSVDADWEIVSGQVGGVFDAPAETKYDEVIGATTDEMGQPALLSVTRARIAPGKVAAAVTASTEILHHVNKATGLDGLLMLTSAGPMNEISWVFGVESGTDGDAALATLGADPAWIEMTDSSGPLFDAGSGERLYLARLP